MALPHPTRSAPRSRAWSALVLFLLAEALIEGSRVSFVSAVSAAQHVSRTVRVTVVSDKGGSVTDLTSADFELKEDGKTRAVLTVEPMAEPLSVAVLLDDRGSDINEIRSALVAFVARVQGRAEVSLVSVVPTPMTVFDYTSSTPAMMAGIQRLVWRAGAAGGLILGAVADAADALRRREVARPAIVVVTFEGDEFRSHRPANTILAALERSGATLHVVAVGTPTMRKLNRAVVESGDAQGDDWTVDQQNRNAVLGEGPKQSGGRRQELAVATGLSKALEAAADDLLNQYALVYAGATDSKPSRKLSVSVTRRGVTIRAPTRITG